MGKKQRCKAAKSAKQTQVPMVSERTEQTSAEAGADPRASSSTLSTIFGPSDLSIIQQQHNPHNPTESSGTSGGAHNGPSSVEQTNVIESQAAVIRTLQDLAKEQKGLLATYEEQREKDKKRVDRYLTMVEEKQGEIEEQLARRVEAQKKIEEQQRHITELQGFCSEYQNFAREQQELIEEMPTWKHLKKRRGKEAEAEASSGTKPNENSQINV